MTEHSCGLFIKTQKQQVQSKNAGEENVADANGTGVVLTLLS